jgi:spore germination cell wall hydrolase CwlJ-like protein
MIKYLRWAIRLVLLAVVATGAAWAVNWTVTNKLARLRGDQSSQSADATSLKARERQLLCMTQNIYYEAGSEPAEGKLAVAQVVMNRSKSGQFPEDLCKVIYQKNVFYEKTVCQFSWYCEGKTDFSKINKNQKNWQESADAAKMVLMEGFRLPSLKTALYYHADYVSPNWDKDRLIKIGRHIFYKDKGNKNG